MSVLIILLALGLLMYVAYRGMSVILFAPVAAVLAVVLTNPAWVPAWFYGLFMERMVGFVKLYFPVFLLGAIFGKFIELSGFARSIISAVTAFIGARHAMLAVVLVCAILTYGGVSLFVVAFAVYPFAAELFRTADVPKRLIPATIALGAFTFTMDALPGTPQIQNIIPTTFFGTDTWAAPWLGVCGGGFVLVVGMAYLQWRQRAAARAGEGYGEGHANEPVSEWPGPLPHPALAVAPLLVVGFLNKLLTGWIPAAYGKTVALPDGARVEVEKLTAIWAVEGALVAAIVLVGVVAFRRIRVGVTAGLQGAVNGAVLAALNTGSEYGFGAVIAALPGFAVVREVLTASVRDPLLNVAVTTNVLSGITGSASGGMSIALGAMGQTYLQNALAAGISPEVLHRVAAMASGGMDTLPHNGAVITLLTVTGLTHRQAYAEILGMTGIKTVAVFLVIGLYRWLGVQ